MIQKNVDAPTDRSWETGASYLGTRDKPGRFYGRSVEIPFTKFAFDFVCARSEMIFVRTGPQTGQ